jgi:nucleotide-binding universal stress UspA family protein
VHHDDDPEDGRRRRPWGATEVLSRASDSTRVAGQSLLDDAASRATNLGARAIVALTEAESTAAGILELADLRDADLVILGATRREADGGLFLGHTVERLLRRCGATIVVVISPPERTPNGA